MRKETDVQMNAECNDCDDVRTHNHWHRGSKEEDFQMQPGVDGQTSIQVFPHGDNDYCNLEMRKHCEIQTAIRTRLTHTQNKQYIVPDSMSNAKILKVLPAREFSPIVFLMSCRCDLNMCVRSLIVTDVGKTEAHHALYATRSTADALLTREMKNAANPAPEPKYS